MRGTDGSELIPLFWFRESAPDPFLSFSICLGDYIKFLGDIRSLSLKLRAEIKRWCYRKCNILVVFGQIWDNPIFWRFWVAIFACQLWDRNIIKCPYRLFFRWKNWKDLLRNILLLENLDFSYARNILGPNFFMSDILMILIPENRIFWLF